MFLFLIWRGFYILSLIPLFVSSTSVAYWGCSPVFQSWTRSVDISVVMISALVQAYVSLFSSTGPYYWLFMGLAGLFYAESHYIAWPAYDAGTDLSTEERKYVLWGATYAHCLVYLSAAFATLILLNGEIVGLW